MADPEIAYARNTDTLIGLLPMLFWNVYYARVFEIDPLNTRTSAIVL